MEAIVSAAPKIAVSTAETRPVRPRTGKVNIAAAHKAISQRYPKVLAELAK